MVILDERSGSPVRTGQWVRFEDEPSANYKILALSVGFFSVRLRFLTQSGRVRTATVRMRYFHRGYWFHRVILFPKLKGSAPWAQPKRTK